MRNPKELLYDWMGGNDVLFLGINDIRGAYYDKCMHTISWIGDHKHFPIYFAAIFIFAALSVLWKVISKQYGKWQYSCIWLGVLLMLLLGYGATGFVTNTAKEYFAYPRPYVALASTGQVHKLEATTPKDDFRSFPSGHVAFTTFMVIVLAPVLTDLLAWCGFWLILLMAWSRISLGMHFPADVMASIMIIAPMIVMLRWALYTSLRKLFGIKC